MTLAPMKAPEVRFYNATNADKHIEEMAAQRALAIHAHDGNLNDRTRFVGLAAACPFCHIDKEGC